MRSISRTLWTSSTRADTAPRDMVEGCPAMMVKQQIDRLQACGSSPSDAVHGSLFVCSIALCICTSNSKLLIRPSHDGSMLMPRFFVYDRLGITSLNGACFVDIASGKQLFPVSKDQPHVFQTHSAWFPRNRSRSEHLPRPTHE